MNELVTSRNRLIYFLRDPTNKNLLVFVISILLINQFNFGVYTVSILCLLIAFKRKSIRIDNISYFYIFLIGISILHLLIQKENSSKTLFFIINCFTIVLLTSLLNSLQLSADKKTTAIQILTLLNLSACILQIFLVMYKTNTLFPYWLENSNEYGMSTGDKIKGIFNYSSYYNAYINLFFLIYFIKIKNIKYQFISIFSIVLCTSNLITILTLLIILINLLKTRSISGIIILFGFNILTCMISFKNYNYVRGAFFKNNTEHSDNIRENNNMTEKYTKNIDMQLKLKPEDKSKETPKTSEKQLRVIISTIQNGGSKLYSFQKNYQVWSKSLCSILFGFGSGNLSSKLAFRASGDTDFGKYPKKFVCSSAEFKNGDLLIYKTIKNMEISFHSIKSYPFSGFTMLIGEYGLIGFFSFIVIVIFSYSNKTSLFDQQNQYMLIFLIFSVFEFTFESIPLITFLSIFLNQQVENND